MNKYQFEDLISDYIENKIKSDDKNNFEVYINENKEAFNLVNSIKSNIKSFKKIPKIKVNEDFNENLLSKVKIYKNKTIKKIPAKAFMFGFTRSQLFLSFLLIFIFSFTSYELISEIFYNNSNKNIIITNNFDSDINGKPDNSNNIVNSDSNFTKKSNSRDIDYSKNIKFVND